MKGPSGRRQYKGGRNWLCPRCGKLASTPGSVTCLPCPSCTDAAGNAVWMSLQETMRPHRKGLPSILPDPEPGPSTDV